LKDLTTSQDMDREVVDNGDMEGFKGEKDVHFELLLSRIKGLLVLKRLGYEDNWGIEDIFADARKELHAAKMQPEHKLFCDIEPAGQIQRLDSALLEHYRLLSEEVHDEESRRKIKSASAKIGIRMLIEDDYLIGEAALLALQTVIEHTEYERGSQGIGQEEDPLSSSSNVLEELYGYRHQISEAISLQFTRNDVFARETFMMSNLGDVSMECF